MCMLSAEPEQESACMLPHTLIERAVLCIVVFFVLRLSMMSQAVSSPFYFFNGVCLKMLVSLI